MADFCYSTPFQISHDDTSYRCISKDGVEALQLGGETILKVSRQALALLAEAAMNDVSFYLRKAHLAKVASILDDPESSDNDRYVAATLIRNSMEAAGGVLPTCQDTGTAIVMAKKGEKVWTEGDDAEALSLGIYNSYTKRNLRYSQMAPLNMFDEKNTGCNLPAQIDIYSTKKASYEFLFMAKGGGSANKTYLYQETKSLLNDSSLTKFVREKVFSLGTAACPPYHIAFVIGGTSAEGNLKVVKLASTGYYDNIPTSGDATGRAFRDLEWEQKIHDIARNSGIGAQFGGKYLAHDVRVIRLPRHAASCPVGLGVSCSADRNIKAKITAEGVFLEELEKNPQQYEGKLNVALKPPVSIDLNTGMDNVLKELSRHAVGTRLSLNGTVIVARDIAHAKIRELLEAGKGMPEYFKNHPVYYAGPAKTPEGMPSGSFGPTTAGRMDVYVDEFMAQKGSMVMLAKGNRSDQVTKACHQHGGFYLGSIGGPAAILARESILKVEIVDFEELGMEAVRKIEVKNFPAFIICDDKGGNLFDQFKA
jgi:fumarate hydratase, class I